jgi:acetyl-CoA carboxylase biotin carboxylase subunit
VGGIRTNIGFFRQILEDPEFRAGNLHTEFIEEFFERDQRPKPSARLVAVAALAAAVHGQLRTAAAAAQPDAPSSAWRREGRSGLLR